MKEQRESSIYLDRFFTPLLTEYRSYRKWKDKFNKYLSEDFNLVEIFSPDENRISDIIVSLLNPNAGHGQGSLFLQIFISLLNQLSGNLNFEEDPKNVFINREYYTYQGRRIDIMIELDNFVIGIENKPWTRDQKDQIRDYNEFLSNYFGKYKGKKYILIYLSGDGSSPSSIKKEERKVLEKEGRLMVLSYSRFLNRWLNESYPLCESEKLRYFVKDFIQWVNKNFREVVNE
jgi:hypothetical protein